MNAHKSALRGTNIRKGNEKLVLRLIQQYGHISQSRIVDITGLKAPTILRIFTNLSDMGLIQKTSINIVEPAEKKGRKPVYYTLNPNALFVIGVEFWVSYATIIITNFTREPVISKSIPIDPNCTGIQALTKISSSIQELITTLNLQTEQVIGIGIGAPGRVDTHKGIVQFYSKMSGLDEINLKEFFTNKLGIEVLVHNNTSVIAMNEYQNTFAEKKKSLFAILLRGGVGGAYINNGEIVTSGNLTSFEIGHMSINPEGRLCSCGWRGCLETYLSEKSIIKDIQDAGIASITIESIGEFLTAASGKEKKIITGILDEKSKQLAFALKNITNLLSPDLFLLITRNSKLSTYLARKVREELKKFPPFPEIRTPKIKGVLYNSENAGLGSCDLVFQNFWKNSQSAP